MVKGEEGGEKGGGDGERKKEGSAVSHIKRMCVVWSWRTATC